MRLETLQSNSHKRPRRFSSSTKSDPLMTQENHPENPQVTRRLQIVPTYTNRVSCARKHSSTIFWILVDQWIRHCPFSNVC